MKFRSRLNLCLKTLERHGTLKVNNGYTLAWVPETESFGFESIYQKDADEAKIIITQIDSEVAWHYLIQYARSLTDAQGTILAANLALNEIRRRANYDLT